jgi:Dullard-like phosphatase family protein
MTTHLKKKLILQPKHKSPLFSSILLSKVNLPSTHNKPTLKKSKPSKLKATSQSPIKLNSSTPYTKDKIKEKTLVIDLDETLVHSDFTFFYNPDVILKVGIDDDDPNTKCDVYVSIRPGVKEFLCQLSSYYEIVFFTASCESYAKPIMNYIDEKKVVSHKFFRKNCTEQEGVYIKDLAKLDKDLRNVVLLDNNIYSYAFQRENGIPIRSWYGDYNDIELYKLIPLLKNLSGFYDVRTEIPKFVMNNTFIWMKGINWLKEHLLNTTYYVEVENVMQMERRNCSLSQESIRSNNNNNILTVEGGLTPLHKNSYDNRSDSSSGSNNNNISNNTTTKVLNGRTVLRTKTQSSSASKEKDNNDCIKITNNFFYDSSANIKIIDNNDDGGGVSSSNKEKQLYNTTQILLPMVVIIQMILIRIYLRKILLLLIQDWLLNLNKLMMISI